MRVRHNGCNNRGQRLREHAGRCSAGAPTHNPPPTLPQHLFARRRVAPWTNMKVSYLREGCMTPQVRRFDPCRQHRHGRPATTVLTGRRPAPPPRSSTWTHGRANIPRGIALSGHGGAGCRACVGRSGETTAPATPLALGFFPALGFPRKGGQVKGGGREIARLDRAPSRSNGGPVTPLIMSGVPFVENNQYFYYIITKLTTTRVLIFIGIRLHVY